MTSSPSAMDPAAGLAPGDAGADLLARLPLLTPETIAALTAVAEPLSVPAGAPLFQEGEGGHALYVLRSGIIDSLKMGSMTDAPRHLETIEPGALVGDLSFIDGRPRPTTARARTACQVWRVDPLTLLEQPGGDLAFDNLRAAVAVAVVQSTRRQTDVYTATLERELQASRRQEQFGHFIFYIIGILSLAALVTQVVTTRILDVNIYSAEFTWVYAAMLSLPTAGLIWALRLPLGQFGLGRAGLARSVREGLLASAGLVLLAVGAAGLSRHLSWMPDLSLRAVPWTLVVPYVLSAFLQEFVARGLIQRSFQAFFNDRSGARAVVLTAIIFGLLHLHFGVGVFAITLVSSLVFGAFFQRHHHVAGVTLLHFTAGVCANALGFL